VLGVSLVWAFIEFSNTVRFLLFYIEDIYNFWRIFYQLAAMLPSVFLLELKQN
jgi:hypothetical protein